MEQNDGNSDDEDTKSPDVYITEQVHCYNYIYIIMYM